MKRPDTSDSHKRANRSVAWWSVLLLAALVVVLAALFLSARLLLNLDETQDFEKANGASGSPLRVALVLRAGDGPRGSADW